MESWVSFDLGFRAVMLTTELCYAVYKLSSSSRNASWGVRASDDNGFC